MAATSYAKRLTPRTEKGGGLGKPEKEEAAMKSAAKMIQVADMLKASKKTVVLTGAGISTSAGVADFRGPNGVWTAEKAGKPPPKSADFDQAIPTLTHMALVALAKADYVGLVVSQNVDALHLRSGLPPHKLAELHGNIFLESCESCGKEVLRDFDVGGMSFQPTGRRCPDPSCRGVLIDQLLDWDDALPEQHLQRAETELREADLAICLGTSLRIKPASELPLLCTKNGGKLIICNLQATPKDGHAHIIVRTQVDNFFQGVMALLDVPIPPATRSIRLMAGAERVVHDMSKQQQGHGHGLFPISDPLDQKASHWEVGVWSLVGKDCPVPLIKSVSLRAEASSGGVDTLAVLTKPPFTLVMPCSPRMLSIDIEPTLPNGETMSIKLDLTESMLREVELKAVEICFPHQDEEGRKMHAQQVRDLASLMPAPPERIAHKRHKGEPLGLGWMQCMNPQCKKWGRATGSRRAIEDEPWFCRRRCLLAASEGERHVKQEKDDEEAVEVVEVGGQSMEEEEADAVTELYELHDGKTRDAHMSRDLPLE